MIILRNLSTLYLKKIEKLYLIKYSANIYIEMNTNMFSYSSENTSMFSHPIENTTIHMNRCFTIPNHNSHYSNFTNHQIDLRIAELVLLSYKFNIIDKLTYPYISNIYEFENEFYRLIMNIECSNEEFNSFIQTKKFPDNLPEMWKRPWVYTYYRKNIDCTFYNIVVANKFNILDKIDPTSIIKNTFNTVYYEHLSNYLSSLESYTSPDSFHANWKYVWHKYKNNHSDYISFLNMLSANKLKLLSFINIKSDEKGTFNKAYYQGIECYIQKVYPYL